MVERKRMAHLKGWERLKEHVKEVKMEIAI